MNYVKKISLILTIIFLFNSSSIYASERSCTWTELLETSEIIATAFLDKIESDMKNNKHLAYFEIYQVYKGEKIKNVTIISGAILSTGSIYLKELGKYIIFLKKIEGTHSNYSLESKRFLKCNYLRNPEGKPIEVADENSYNYIRDIPNELFTEEEIRLTVFGKQFDYKARIINFRSLERWFEINSLNWKDE
ncbi:MAG: hypothetical protein L6416_03725 [Candidatus Omnitrophica bacterium]|nr:hypothetical protein [Candidatus Omnitrophota bacterium]